jgi:hypothetical protein
MANALAVGRTTCSSFSLALTIACTSLKNSVLPIFTEGMPSVKARRRIMAASSISFAVILATGTA